MVNKVTSSPSKGVFRFLLGFLVGSSLFIGVSIAQQIYNCKDDGFIGNGYMIDKCPPGYFPHTFKAGDKYCLRLLREIPKLVEKSMKR